METQYFYGLLDGQNTWLGSIFCYTVGRSPATQTSKVTHQLLRPAAQDVFLVSAFSCLLQALFSRKLRVSLSKATQHIKGYSVYTQHEEAGIAQDQFSVCFSFLLVESRVSCIFWNMNALTSAVGSPHFYSMVQFCLALELKRQQC